MSELTAGERSCACAQYSRALKRRTISGATMAATVGLQEVPWESISGSAHFVDPTLHGATIVVGLIFGIDVLIGVGVRVKRWMKDRVVVVHLGPRDRPDDE